MSIEAGELCHRITIEKLGLESRDEDGNFLPSAWVPISGKPLFAKVEYLSVRDVLTAQANNSETRARCKLRWSTLTKQVDTTMRLIFEGNIFSIDGPPQRDNINGKIYMTLMLSNGVEQFK